MVGGTVNITVFAKILPDQLVKVLLMGAGAVAVHIGIHNFVFPVGEDQFAGEVGRQHKAVKPVRDIVVADLSIQMAEKQCLRILGCEKICVLPVALQKGAGEKVIVFSVQVGVKPQRVYQQNHGKDRKEEQGHSGRVTGELPA